MITSLLTKKQAWRRQIRNAQRQEQHDTLFKEFTYADRASKTEIPARSFSAPTVSSLIELALSSNKWGTTGNLKENVSTRIKKQMGVRFDKILRVVLIPARIDYAISNLTESLWWNEDDYKKFRDAAFVELDFLMSMSIQMKIGSKREALDIMYQPRENEIYGEDDENFFLYLDSKSASSYSETRSASPEIPELDCVNCNRDCDTIDLFGKSKPTKMDDIFDTKNKLSVAVLNIHGLSQISRSEEKKRDEDKTKEKEKEICIEESIRVHPLASICG